MSLGLAGCSRRRRHSSGAIGLWLLVGLTVAVVALFFLARVPRTPLAPATPLPVFGRVSGFQLTNQLAQSFSSAELEGNIWVADLIFTRCPGPCAQLSAHLAQLQRRLPPGVAVQLISLTADPDHDTPEVLRAYAERFQADPRRWRFLTGPRAEINEVATKQLLLAVAEKDPAERESADDLFLHSTKWVLVDAQGQLRAVYEGTEEQSVDRVLADIQRLAGGTR